MKVRLYSTAIFLKDVDEKGFKLAFFAPAPIDKYALPEGMLCASLAPIKKILFKTEVAAGRGDYYYLLDGHHPDLPHHSLNWHELDYLDKSSPLKDSIVEVNHSILEDLQIYLNKLKNKKLLGYLWD